MAGPPSAPHRPMVACNMCDEDVIARVAKIFGVGYRKRKARKDHWSDSFFVCIKGKKAVELMRQMKPLMSKRRSQQIEKALASYRPDSRYKLTDKDVESIKQLLSEGVTHAKIASMFGVTRSRISHLKKKLKDS